MKGGSELSTSVQLSLLPDYGFNMAILTLLTQPYSHRAFPHTVNQIKPSSLQLCFIRETRQAAHAFPRSLKAQAQSSWVLKS